MQEWTGSLRGEMAQVSGEFARLCLYWRAPNLEGLKETISARVGTPRLLPYPPSSA